MTTTSHKTKKIGGEKNMGELNKWIKKSSKFLKLADGETITAVFREFKFIQSSFDADKEVVRYTLETPDGEKLWETGSKSVAQFFDKVEPGQSVKIKRWGSGNDTEYILSIVEGIESKDNGPEEPEPNQPDN